MASFDRILDQMGLVVIDLNTHFIQIEGITDDLSKNWELDKDKKLTYNSLDIKVSIDGGAATEIDEVSLDTRSALLSLNVDAISVA